MMGTWHDSERWGAALAFTLGAFACSSGSGEATSGAGGTGGTGGPGTGGNGGTTTVASSSSSPGVGAVASSSGVGSGGAGGSMSFVCDPPAEPGSLYEMEAESYDLDDIEPVSLCKYRGEVLLIVNTAAA